MRIGPRNHAEHIYSQVAMGKRRKKTKSSRRPQRSLETSALWMLSPALRTILGEISGVILIAFVALAALEVSGKRIGGSGAAKDGDDEDENLSPEARAIRKRYLQAKAKQAAKDAPLDDETLERMCKAACHDETPDDATLQRMAASEDGI